MTIYNAGRPGGYLEAFLLQWKKKSRFDRPPPRHPPTPTLFLEEWHFNTEHNSFRSGSPAAPPLSTQDLPSRSALLLTKSPSSRTSGRNPPQVVLTSLTPRSLQTNDPTMTFDFFQITSGEPLVARSLLTPYWWERQIQHCALPLSAVSSPEMRKWRQHRIPQRPFDGLLNS